MGGIVLSEKLRYEYNIQVEMADLNNILMISSIGDSKKSFEVLYNALYDISVRQKGNMVMGSKYNIDIIMPEYKKILNMKQAYYSKKREVKLKEASGLVSAEMAAPYPPGVPVILPGEIITSEIIEYLNEMKRSGIPINGLSDKECNNIYVIE
jgi:arginine/lysine/ornithine decarboxylase